MEEPLSPSLARRSAVPSLPLHLTQRLGVALIAEVAGGLIYLLWRSKALNVFSWIERLGYAKSLDSIRASDWASSMSPPSWLLFSLPSALWLFGGLVVFDSIWGKRASASKTFWLCTFGAIAVGAEVGQALKRVAGTFDWQDIAFMGIAGLGAFLVSSSSRPGRRKET